ncbi:MAG: SH3 domain-containing protein [Thermodesulfobacteriota bacterium]|nr:SH3 domain-containing protein [Thermodesulfobacteriota bacterium]
MRKLKIDVFVFFLIFLTGAVAFAVVHKMMSVQVKNGQIRTSPTFLSKIVARVSYGDQVGVSEEKGEWFKVAVTGSRKAGWMHSTSLSPKRIVLKPGAEDVRQAADSDEIALAGKGFSQQVENEFRQRNPNIDFTWVDKMEKMTATQAQIQKFVKDGGLFLEGGGI